MAIWDIAPDRLAAAVCELAGRSFTATEWTTYLGELGGRGATRPGPPVEGRQRG